MRSVQWSRSALDDFKQQIKFIAAHDPYAAKRVADKVMQAAASLGERPTGRPGRVSNTSEKSVAGIPYIIAYSLSLSAEGERISILRVIHTAQNWPKETWPQQ